jgi:general secretion pathway protein E
MHNFDIATWPKAGSVLHWLLEHTELGSGDIARARKLAERMVDEDEEVVRVLLRLGLLSDEQAAVAYAQVLGVPRYPGQAPDEAPAIGTERFLRQYAVAPIERCATGLVVAAAAPVSRYALRALEHCSGQAVSVVVATAQQVQELIERSHGQGRSAMDALIDDLDAPGERDDDVEHLRDLASEAPVIRLVNLILQKAVDFRASDVHVEPFEDQLQVRYRVDGLLLNGESPPTGYAAAVVSRLKIMARLDIAERRLPQDGRIMLRLQGRELDLRVSTVPTSFGESVVMRLLDRQNVRFDFAHLGIDGPRLQALLGLLEYPHGILLVTGPTGSGKTTTLYTALLVCRVDRTKCPVRAD